MLLLGGAELYYRRTASYLEDLSSEALSLSRFAFESGECLVNNTRRGRRMVRNAHVVIHNHDLSKRDIVVRTNALGFRDRDLYPTKALHEYRILALGDSITLGDYLEADEVYVERMERYLNAAAHGLHFEVVNTGVSDIGVKEAIDILEERGLGLFPDHVFLTFYLNDSRPPWGFAAELGSRGWLRRHSVLAKKIYSKLKQREWVAEDGEGRFNWVKDVKRLDWSTDRRAFLELASLARYDWGAAWEPGFAEIVDRELDRLRSLAQRHQFGVTVVAFPVSYQVYASFSETRPQQILKEAAGARDFSYVDLLPVLQRHRSKKLFFDHCHPNEFANDVIGKALADFFVRDVLEELGEHSSSASR